MGGYSTVPGGSEAALAKVKPPAIALMIFAGLSILFNIVFLLLRLVGSGLGTALAHDNSGRMMALLSGGLGLAAFALGMLFYGVAIFGALKMSKLESYTMAWVATVICALPCGYCCCLGLGLAIWSAVVLMNDEVKAAFTA
jgi:hypothetical protein